MRIIAGRWGGRTIAAPRGLSTRPTTDRVREAWMSAVQPELPGATVLDLFAGSGALGLEALSRGAERATFVDDAPAALRAVRDNIAALGAGERAEVARADAIRYAATLEPGAFDVAFADPPYGRDLAAAVVTIWTARPFSRILCVEHERSEVLPAASLARERHYGDTVVSFLTVP